MLIIRLLQRKTVISIVIAIVVGLALGQFITAVAIGLGALFSGLINQATELTGTIYNWRTSLFDPSVLFILQMFVLEVFIRAAVLFGQLKLKVKRS